MTPFYEDAWLQVWHGDCREVMTEMEPESVHCVVTSPPYWGLRDYGEAGQLGLERTPDEYVANLVAVFREVRRVLRKDGTVWLNLGDCYATGAGSYRNPGSDVAPIENGGKQAFTRDYARAQPNRMPLPGLKPKDLVGIPWRVAFALQADGWYLRSDIIWSKPNPMPESVTDRPTKSHEYIFLLSKSPRYYFDAAAVADPVATGTVERFQYTHQYATRAHREGVTPISGGIRPDAIEPAPPTRNIRSVWTMATQPYPGAHFATFPETLPERCIKAGCPEGGVVLDPFAGSGTTGMVAQSLSRRAVLIDLSLDYLDQLMARNVDIPLGLGA